MFNEKEIVSIGLAAKATRLTEKLEERKKDLQEGTIFESRSLDETILKYSPSISKDKTENNNDSPNLDRFINALNSVLKKDLPLDSVSLQEELKSSLRGNLDDLSSDEEHE